MGDPKLDLFWLDFQNIIQQVSKEFDSKWQVSKEFDSKWQIRKRLIDTKFLVFFIFKIILSKNKQGYNSILHELWDSTTQAVIELPKNKPIAASSVCEARQKMSETIFIKPNEAILSQGQCVHPSINWHNHRIFAIDGC